MHTHIITCKELSVETDKANLILTDVYTLLQSALNRSSFPAYYVTSGTGTTMFITV